MKVEKEENVHNKVIEGKESRIVDILQSCVAEKKGEKNINLNL